MISKKSLVSIGCLVIFAVVEIKALGYIGEDFTGKGQRQKAKYNALVQEQGDLKYKNKDLAEQVKYYEEQSKVKKDKQETIVPSKTIDSLSLASCICKYANNCKLKGSNLQVLGTLKDVSSTDGNSDLKRVTSLPVREQKDLTHNSVKLTLFGSKGNLVNFLVKLNKDKDFKFYYTFCELTNNKVNLGLVENEIPQLNGVGADKKSTESAPQPTGQAIGQGESKTENSTENKTENKKVSCSKEIKNIILLNDKVKTDSVRPSTIGKELREGLKKDKDYVIDEQNKTIIPIKDYKNMRDKSTGDGDGTEANKGKPSKPPKPKEMTYKLTLVLTVYGQNKDSINKVDVDTNGTLDDMFK